jgi:hypothetical protein
VLVLDKLGSPVTYSVEQQLLWKPSTDCAEELERLGLLEIHQSSRIRGQSMQDASLMLIGLRHVVPTLPSVWDAATPVMSGCGGLSLQWHSHNNTLQSIAGRSGQTPSGPGWRLGTSQRQDEAKFEGKLSCAISCHCRVHTWH